MMATGVSHDARFSAPELLHDGSASDAVVGVRYVAHDALVVTTRGAVIVYDPQRRAEILNHRGGRRLRQWSARPGPEHALACAAVASSDEGAGARRGGGVARLAAVSYTHLTLPTILLV